ncbi:MAG: hypothetical protein AAFO84_03085, partial [Cyanobacteria bacterium J06598_1]
MANFSVTKSTDNGSGKLKESLSWAIKKANQNAGSDTITLTTDVTLTGQTQTDSLISSNVTVSNVDFDNNQAYGGQGYSYYA